MSQILRTVTVTGTSVGLTPCFYIKRENGDRVALIAIDELPREIRLQNVPPVLPSHGVTEMHFVCDLPSPGQTYELEHDVDVKDNVQQTRSEPDVVPAPEGSHVVAEPAITNAAETSSRSLSSSSSTIALRPARKTQRTDKGKGTTPTRATTKDSRHSPPTPVHHAGKIYCTYWIRTGECDFEQQGCKYKHVMPERKILVKIGFRSTPKWWLEKMLTQRHHRAPTNKRPRTTTQDDNKAEHSASSMPLSDSRFAKATFMKSPAGKRRARSPAPVVHDSSGTEQAHPALQACAPSGSRLDAELSQYQVEDLLTFGSPDIEMRDNLTAPLTPRRSPRASYRTPEQRRRYDGRQTPMSPALSVEASAPLFKLGVESLQRSIARPMVVAIPSDLDIELDYE